MEPFEVVAAPLTVWVGPVGTAFPDVDEAPSGTWFKLGTSGDKNYGDDGVVVTHQQTITPWTPAGSTMPRKVWRTSEGIMIGFTLVDISAPQYAKILNDGSVTQTAAGAGTPGYDSVPLYQGIEVAAFALVARGLSPADEALAAQYQVPIVYQGAEPAVTYNKGTPAGLAIQFTALFDDDSGGVGDLIVQTAVAS